MKEFVIITIGFLLFMAMLEAIIPSSNHYLHIGDGMRYETDLDVQMKQELLLIK